jgi:hypothetical protein
MDPSIAARRLQIAQEHDTPTSAEVGALAAPDGTGGDDGSFDAMISADGHWIVYFSWASNLTADPDTNGRGDVFVTSNPLLPVVSK